ncbi:hypothetical protein R1sor_011129 [Riccia sorocarpa]|uniref:J domain-containing protein n=1 Tax=Riccia sorocarpa TaxID=122646 RepID=A0ABD3I011_9MARC
MFGFQGRASQLARAVRQITNPRLRPCGSVLEGLSRTRWYGNSPEGEEEFWIVEGGMLRIRGIQDRSLLKVIEKGTPPPGNPNLSKKQIAAARLNRVMASRLTQSERGQEAYWATYFERYRNMRGQAEKLFRDGKPEVERPAEVVDKTDPFTILGLKRREKPYSPVEIRAAYRKMALKYHPDHNPGKDSAAKFERIWNAYKMLQHKRSWR